MATKAHAEKLARSLESTGLAQVVKATSHDDRINILCRVMEGNEKKWVELVHRLLLVTLQESDGPHAWQSHICRHYFLREENGVHKLVWGWNISVQSITMPMSLDVIVDTIKGKPVKEKSSNGEISEFPLGAPLDRNSPGPSGKGVYTIGEQAFHPARK